MKIVVISDEELRAELLAQGIMDNSDLEWVSELTEIPDAGCYIDLLFDYTADRVNELLQLQPALIIVNAVNSTMNELPANFIRINGWATFLCRPVIEAACSIEELKEKAETIFSGFNKTIEWTPDMTGFISPRVISMIINEAYFTLEDAVSGKDEIDTAMKLGTKYPYGPFEWSKKIGLRNIFDLLHKLSSENKRYTPAGSLKKEALSL